MSLYWYACISTNTYCFEMYHIPLEMNWWALSNASSIMWIHLAIHEILADKAFTAADGLISQSFVIAFIHPTYVQIALIWGFPAQLSLWKSVHWLWRYKLNESSHSNSLFGIADSFSLDISKPLKNVPTRFSDNDQNAKSILDLVFLYLSSPEFNYHHIHPN